MNKPMDLAVADTKQSIIDLLNNSGIALSSMSMLLHEVSDTVDTQLEVQVKRQREAYEQELKMEQQALQQQKELVNNVEGQGLVDIDPTK